MGVGGGRGRGNEGGRKGIEGSVLITNWDSQHGEGEGKGLKVQCYNA